MWRGEINSGKEKKDKTKMNRKGCGKRVMTR